MTWLFSVSRSRRKTPIFGNASGQSEREDKKAWHSRFRSRERTELATARELDAHLTVLEKQVSNTWAMAKDGRSYWPSRSQEEIAESKANWQGRSPEERASLKARLLHKWAGK